jgi:hypothetical protein
MYKIVGRLIGGEPTTDGIGVKEIEKAYKARRKFTLIIKVLYAKCFYDWVKVEEYKE